MAQQVFKSPNTQADELTSWEQQNELKPKASTPDQQEKIRHAAIKEFGLLL